MSALEDELCRELNQLPTYLLDRVFWSRKLPQGFRFYLQMVSRRLMLGRPVDYLLQAAELFETLLAQRDVELNHLPSLPYLEKLKKTQGVSGELEKLPVNQVAYIRCSRCGRLLPAAARLAGETSHVEGDEECRVIALSMEKDGFGRCLARCQPTRRSQDAINTRSLAYLVDY